MDSADRTSDKERPTVRWIRRWPRHWWINALLFAATFLTSTVFGSALVYCFAHNSPLNLEAIANSYLWVAKFDTSIWDGLYFSLPLLAVLLAHELGHVVECRKRKVDASLPYFLPSPSLFGTFGAFIRIRSPIYSREGLFDIGIAGPLAGFIMLLPFLVIGVAMSKVVPHAVTAESVFFGTPLVVRLLERVWFAGVPSAQIVLHPIAMAAWAGLFATALNLLPIGQLDGGHILYALGSERWHGRVSLILVAVLGVAGFFYWPWWIWGVIMFFFGRRHPLVYDSTPLSRPRRLLCVAALIIFFLSVTLVPVRTA
ncbi:MAG: site-2 protease family protein [Acidobacteriota bacterium]|nr:site-2 protease family protein [Acidobacteriota bacterium]